MEEKSEKLWEILVPSRSNYGKEYSMEHHREWDKYVRKLSGGITILRTAKGQWVGPRGELFFDEMIPVRIFCNERSIDDIIDYTMTHYDQEAIFAYEVSSNVKLKNRDKKE